MRYWIRDATISAFATLLVAVAAVPAPAQDENFAAGSRVEGRIGSRWDRCTTIGERRITGGYVLRCDSEPGVEAVFAASDVRSMQGPDRSPVRTPHVTAQVALASARVAAADLAFKGGPPAAGVYGCMNQDAQELPGLQFGLLDASTYSTYEGGRGRYSYSSASGTLTFTSGPFAGMRESRDTERAFRMLDEHGSRTAFLCPLTPKDPHKKHW
jgi:hypothetical protein